MRVAITRQVSPDIGRCELSYLERRPIDVEVARRQHAAYERCLADLGCSLVSLPPEPGLPDSVFVEDAAVVLDELALITRPGAASRRAETATVAAALSAHRPLHHLGPPGTLDGGDVLVAERRVFVGRSRRSDEAGWRWVRERLGPLGYEVIAVPVHGVLHLKSAVSRLPGNRLLADRTGVDASLFAGAEIVDVDPSEPGAANVLCVGEVVVCSAAFERTRRRLEHAGIAVVTVDVSELAKAEGAVTCCSLVFESPAGVRRAG